jgi:hypothetical protein
MALQVGNGALIKCTFGTAPVGLIVPPINRTMTGKIPGANIFDNKPFAQIPPFALCTTPSNPQVAKMFPVPPPGVLKPQPCTPVIAAPWLPAAPTTMIGNMPTLVNAATATCSFGGVVQILVPACFTVMAN